MKINEQILFNKSIFRIPIVSILLIWMVYIVEIKFGFNFNNFGVYPREIIGFRGVFLMHFIHSDTSHLLNNSLPLFVLLSCVFMFYRESALKILLLGGLLTGFLTWVFARPSYHIGASGVVYLLFSFVFFSGIIKKHYRLVAVSFMVIFLYGSMIWYVLPIKHGMSWEGHLSGFLVGLLFAILYRNKGITKTIPHFEETEFDLLFDEEGNFSPPQIEEDILEEQRNL